MNPPQSPTADIEIKYIHRLNEKKILVVCQARSDYEYLATVLKQGSQTVLGELRHIGKTSKRKDRGSSANKSKMHTVFAITSNTTIADTDTVEVHGFQLTFSGNQPELKPLGSPVSHTVKWPFAPPYSGPVTIYTPSGTEIPVDGFIACGVHDQSSPTGKLQSISLDSLTPDFIYDEEGFWSAQFPMLTLNSVYHLLVMLTATKTASMSNLTAV